jgi:signal transduction histidine kinase
VIVLGVDVTESKRTEQVLLQTEKLAAVGRLASSIAHEINNPLEAVTNLLFLAQHFAKSQETQEYLILAEIELRRVSVIANRTLRFYRPSGHLRPVTPEELIESAMALYLGRLTNSQVTVEMRHRAPDPLKCNEGEILQVLSNLVGNAIDAMPSSGGRLLLRTRVGRNWGTGQEGVLFTVADTGTGMSAETIARIFEPFFTTKDINGTGLGLWISQEIVKRHGGMLKVRSSASARRPGSVFSLFLPCVENDRAE